MVEPFSFYKISSSIVDRHNVKKILTFLSEFHSNKVKKLKLEKFKDKFEKNTYFKNQVLETILLLNEKFVIIQKSQILANLFIAHINDDIDWKEFQKISFILTKINPDGFELLEAYSNKKTDTKLSFVRRIEGDPLLVACGIARQFENVYYLTGTGKKLYELGLKPLLKKQS